VAGLVGSAGYNATMTLGGAAIARPRSTSNPRRPDPLIPIRVIVALSVSLIGSTRPNNDGYIPRLATIWEERMKPRLVAGMHVLVVMALLTSACGNGDEASTDLKVTVKEFQFTPNTWTVPAGEEISIDITNQGTVTHEWVLLQQGVNITSEDDLPDTEEELLADFVNVEEEVEAGQTKTLTFQAPPAGTYQIICAIEGHFNGGMQGTLTSSG
jgi:uncharacterized cupredoxin-like copper-binding protein